MDAQKSILGPQVFIRRRQGWFTIPVTYAKRAPLKPSPWKRTIYTLFTYSTFEFLTERELTFRGLKSAAVHSIREFGLARA